MKKLVLVLLFALLFVRGVYAAEEQPADLRVRVIGATFKGLANTYLATYDFEKGQKKFAGKIEKMTEERFAKRYARFWPLLSELPVELKIKYGLTSHMTRQQLIDQVKGIKKQDIQDLINRIPDEAVSREFDRYVKRMGKKLRESDPAQQIAALWHRILTKVQSLEKPKPKPAS